MPIGRVSATAFKLTVTEAAGPPGVSVPPVEETLSQADVLTSTQFKALVPALVSVNKPDVTLKGPPTGPRLVNPLPGLIRRSSGTSNDSRIPAVVLLFGEVALNPIPRLANAAHSSGRLAPPWFTRSACRIPS